MRMPFRRPVAIAALLAAALASAGCFNPWKPLVAGRGIPDPPPLPNSPQNVVRLFRWCYNQRDAFVYRELFSDDYRFMFDAADSAGQAYRDRPWTREDELESTTRLFDEATQIDLTFGRNLTAGIDHRHPDSLQWYQSVRTTVILKVRTADGAATDVTGSTDFFLVRGDVALIPEELWNRGFRPDPNRWYINRWEDKTAGSGGGTAPARIRPASAAAAAGGYVSWGSIKAYYAFPAAASHRAER
jgi:hypothetical protein